jgi:hypothetical protein
VKKAASHAQTDWNVIKAAAFLQQSVRVDQLPVHALELNKLKAVKIVRKHAPKCQALFFTVARSLQAVRLSICDSMCMSNNGFTKGDDDKMQVVGWFPNFPRDGAHLLQSSPDKNPTTALTLLGCIVPAVDIMATLLETRSA